MKTLVYSLIMLFFITAFSSAQVTQQWAAYYNSPSNGEDESTAMTVDNAGNVYVTGRSSSSSTGIDFATVKYNPAGVLQWSVRYNSTGNMNDRPTGIVVDPAGNVYVTGMSNISPVQSVIRTIKYNSAGNQIWEKRTGDSAHSSASTTSGSIALDAGGSLYIGGVTKVNLADNGSYFIIKYSSAGDSLWSKTYDGTSQVPGLGSAISFVKVDGNNVYVSGKSFDANPNRTYVTTIKYDNNGVEQWIRQDSLTSGSDELRGMDIDASGNIILTYKLYMSSGIVKYNSGGVRLWTKYYTGMTGDHYDEVTGVAVDPSGNIYLTGNSDRGDSDMDYMTLKYDAAGNLLWERFYNGTGNDGDYPNDIHIDNEGNSYVTGTAYETGFHTNIVTIKYGSTGDQKWKIHFDGGNNLNDDKGNFVMTDAGGNVFVAGVSEQSGHLGDFAVIKYSQTTGVDPISLNVPDKYSLSQNFPNPFNPETTIRFDIITSGNTKLIVHDITGNEIENIFNETLLPGSYEVKFNGTYLTSGVYFYTLITERFKETKKMIVLK